MGGSLLFYKNRGKMEKKVKKTYSYKAGKKTIERSYSYIPVRYIIAAFLMLFEVCAVVAITVVLCYYVPLFYIAAWLTEIFCVLKIISSDDNPEYKVPGLLVILIGPIAGFMLYFMFYSRKLSKKTLNRLKILKEKAYSYDDEESFASLKTEDGIAAAQAKQLVNIASTHLFDGGELEYFPLGEDKHKRLLEDLRTAEKFIFMEYFIIEEGKFWNSILEILKEKADLGVEVRVIYDDVGCIGTLPGDYYSTLRKCRIKALPFSPLRGNADSEFNNRSHRKITVIDGRIGYTGGVNLADEYINEVKKFGHWKDVALRIEGRGVWELTKLFLEDYGINAKELPEDKHNYYPEPSTTGDGYIIPFGDGPAPLYDVRVGKSVIASMLDTATDYVYITTPYLIIDNDLCCHIESAARKGVDVRIILPHIPDKRIVFELTQSFYPRLIKGGVRIFEYEPGFVHAKSYVADGRYAMVGTINLDYRSLVHHFENGVWMYNTKVIDDIKRDIDSTLLKCIEIKIEDTEVGIFRRLLRAVLRAFATLF